MSGHQDHRGLEEEGEGVGSTGNPSFVATAGILLQRFLILASSSSPPTSEIGVSGGGGGGGGLLGHLCHCLAEMLTILFCIIFLRRFLRFDVFGGAPDALLLNNPDNNNLKKVKSSDGHASSATSKSPEPKKNLRTRSPSSAEESAATGESIVNSDVEDEAEEEEECVSDGSISGDDEDDDDLRDTVHTFDSNRVEASVFGENEGSSSLSCFGDLAEDKAVTDKSAKIGFLRDEPGNNEDDEDEDDEECGQDDVISAASSGTNRSIDSRLSWFQEHFCSEDEEDVDDDLSAADSDAEARTEVGKEAR